MEIYLKNIFNISSSEYNEWTICLNNANEENIYSFDENGERLLEHISWKKHSGASQSFRNISTRYCLQFIRLDKDQKFNHWLFLGAYEICGVTKFQDGHQTYDLKLLERFSPFIERLIIEYNKIQGPKQAKISINNLETIKVISILEHKYVHISKKFEGYDKISLPFSELKTIINGNVDNWRELLENINCVYSITDTLTGKIYIGSTYGYNGVWQRWSVYVKTLGHGNNVMLKKLIDNNVNYGKNFVFTIIESFFNRNGNENYIREREQYWKNVFEARTYGNNKN